MLVVKKDAKPQNLIIYCIFSILTRVWSETELLTLSYIPSSFAGWFLQVSMKLDTWFKLLVCLDLTACNVFVFILTILNKFSIFSTNLNLARRD